MNNQTIKHILMDKGVQYLYHANTVPTACTFLEHGGLLSRAYVENHSLFQTSQKTDDQDRTLGIFNDIFFDSVDIHQRGHELNKYGPVSFVYSIDLIDVLPQGKLKITKDNPIRWKLRMTEEEKYFLNEYELSSCFDKNKFAQHITICNQNEPISFRYLEKIVLDDPQIDDRSYFNEAYDKLSNYIYENAPEIPLEVRECPSSCNCKENYMKHKPGYFYHRFSLHEKEQHDEWNSK